MSCICSVQIENEIIDFEYRVVNGKMFFVGFWRYVMSYSMLRSFGDKFTSQIAHRIWYIFEVLNIDCLFLALEEKF